MKLEEEKKGYNIEDKNNKDRNEVDVKYVKDELKEKEDLKFFL